MTVAITPTPTDKYYAIKHKIPSIHTELYLVPLSDILQYIPNAGYILAKIFVDVWPGYYNHSIPEAELELHKSLHTDNTTLDIFFVIVDYMNIDSNHTIYGCCALLEDDMGVLTQDERNGTAKPIIPNTVYTQSVFSTDTYDATQLDVIDYVQARKITQWIANLYVQPQYRNCGLANAIMTQLAQYAYSVCKFEHVHLDARNIQLVNMYAKLGWQRYTRVWSQADQELMIMRLDLTQLRTSHSAIN